MVIQSSATPSPPIRRIEWSTAGEVLGGEAAAFTPWLSRNLDVIPDALGIDELDLVATEMDVAGKRLDISPPPPKDQTAPSWRSPSRRSTASRTTITSASC